MHRAPLTAYDNDGLLTGSGPLAVTRSAQDGLITSTKLGLATDTRTYNSFGELTGYAAAYKSAPLRSVQFTRDAGGRVSSKTEIIGGTTTAYGYSYDQAGRLTSVTQNGIAAEAYTYDGNSNRSAATISTVTVNGVYDAQDRLLGYGAASYLYTANGELFTKTIGAQKATYQYDVLGNLTTVTLPSGKTISYIIDPQNHRVGEKVNGVLTAEFLYDGSHIVAQLNGSNSLVSQFLYATKTNTPDYMVKAGDIYRIISDRLGSPRLVMDTSTGTIAERIDYDSFGSVGNDTNPGFQPCGFAGGLYYQDTKLVRFGARDYDPVVGRWTAKDPIRFKGGDTNLYGYVLNDPVNLTDPSGLRGLRDWFNDFIKGVKKKFCKKCREKQEADPQPEPEPESEGNGVTAGEAGKDTAIHVGTEAAAEAAEHAVESGALKVIGPAATGVEGTAQLYKGLVGAKEHNQRNKEKTQVVDCSTGEVRE